MHWIWTFKSYMSLPILNANFLINFNYKKLMNLFLKQFAIFNSCDSKISIICEIFKIEFKLALKE